MNSCVILFGNLEVKSMEKILDVKYNIQNIKIFLSLFNLTLEEKETSFKELKIFMEGLEVGKVVFSEEEIIMNTTSMFGDLDAKTNYASAFRMTDVESLQTIQQIGLYASWYNVFNFDLKLFNGSVFSGECAFGIKIDNEFGNTVTPQFKLFYQNDGKKYNIRINKNGYPFQFTENKGFYEEKIVYNIFDTWGLCSYFHHSKSDKFVNGENTYPYYESTFISNTSDKKEMNTAVTHKEFNKRWLVHNYNTFGRVSAEDDAAEEVIHKANYMHLIDPTLKTRINKLIEEFSVGDVSFLEKIILYGFTHYSKEEIYALFGLDQKDIDLEKMYFGEESDQVLERKIFLP